MRESVVEAMSSLSPEMATFILAMLPILELRGAIPYALSVGVDWPIAYALAVAGNLVPVIPILLFLGPVSEKLSRLPGFGAFFEWVWRRSRRRSGLVEKFGPWGLALFVAIPLPVTGGWTGAAVAYLLGIRFHRSFPAIVAGVLLAGIVVTLAVKGMLGLGGLFIGKS